MSKKEPYKSYDALAAKGVKVVWGKPEDPRTYPGPENKFDIIYDNNGKDMEACKTLIDTFKVCTAREGPRASLPHAAQSRCQ